MSESERESLKAKNIENSEPRRKKLYCISQVCLLSSEKRRVMKEFLKVDNQEKVEPSRGGGLLHIA